MLIQFPEKFLLNKASVPSSEVVANTVPVAFHATLHTGELLTAFTIADDTYSND